MSWPWVLALVLLAWLAVGAALAMPLGEWLKRRGDDQ